MSCSNPDNKTDLVEKFEDCYPEKKYDALQKAIRMLDLKVSERYPSTSINKSYEKYAWYFIENGFDSKPLLTKGENDLMLKDLYSVDFFADFYKTRNGDREIDFDGIYFNCLKALNDSAVIPYTESLLRWGTYFGEVRTMSAFAEQEERKLVPIQMMILKIEYLLNLDKTFHNRRLPIDKQTYRKASHPLVSGQVLLVRRHCTLPPQPRVL